jgi:hypothetical protein
MADEASDTFGGSVRNYLGALGFILPLVGFEELIRHFVDTEHPSLPWWLGAAFVVAGYPIYSLPAIWKHLRGGTSPSAKRPLEYLHNEDSELGEAVRNMAWRSADGKWYAAQCLANSPKGKSDDHENDLMHWAAERVWRPLLDGKLDARGRRPGQMNFEAIPQTHWRSSPLHMIRDNATLWKMILIPTGGAEFSPDGTVTGRDPAATQRTNQLANYDSIIVNSRQFEALWPLRDPKTDRERKRLLKKARKAGADPPEIAKLSRDDPQRGVGIVFLIAAFTLGALVVLAFAYIADPEMYRRTTLPPSSAPDATFTQQQVDEKIAAAVANLNSQLAEANRQRDAAKRDGDVLRRQLQNAPAPPRPNYDETRVYTNKTIAELRGFYKDRTALQADAFMADEIGKWIKYRRGNTVH